ncbi:MAG: virulence RhuM family protein, partial [Prevotellaceae bacterium]|nr:virulence RhuM family protein [Candidatus Faecinaster equi]
EDEMSLLKLIVEQFLAFAEAQALAHVPMYMKDWVEKLRIVLTMNQRSVLEDAGRISHALALQKASEEYEKYKAKQLDAEHLASLKELEQDLKNACPQVRTSE